MCEIVNEVNTYKLFIKIAIVEDITESEKNEGLYSSQSIILLMVICE